MAMTTVRVTLPLYNLGCGGSEALAIERAIAALPGVTQAYLNPLTEMAYVVYDPALVDPEQLDSELGRLGYGAPPPVEQRKFTTAPELPAGRSRHPYPQAIAGGLGMAAIYFISLVVALLVPSLFQVVRFWELLLLGVRWATPWT